MWILQKRSDFMSSNRIKPPTNNQPERVSILSIPKDKELSSLSWFVGLIAGYTILLVAWEIIGDLEGGHSSKIIGVVGHIAIFIPVAATMVIAYNLIGVGVDMILRAWYRR